MTRLDLLSTDVEDSLRDTVRSLLTARCTPDRVTAVYDGDDSVAAPLWQALVGELGLGGLLVPEEYGGAGASAREAAVVLSELGRAAAPVPFLTSAVVATLAVLPSGDSDLLGGLASGSVTAALVVPLTAGPSFSPVARASAGRVTGAVPVVAGALEADVLLVPASDGLVAVDPASSGVVVSPVVSLDMTRQLADVAFEGASGRLLPVGPDAVGAALQVGAALLASEQVGIASHCLEETVAYLKERRQFGRVLASYQALKHRLADLFIQVSSAEAAASYAAAVAAAADPDLPVATAVAQAYCSSVAVRAAEEAVQLHGGIGMTWEHPTHLYLKRAKADQLAFGSPDQHLSALAELVDLPA
ncbi:MAG TPA: acyl-CoA dehydrogenase family protein [Marmoricola sp.]|nr:acyl-CoA dehydrogenase family protein [Marmoricola sp.]